jgi:hypothetical protein
MEVLNMDDLTSKISNLLSDPNTMQQIQALSGMLSQNSGEKQENSMATPEPANNNAGNNKNQIDANALSGLLASLSSSNNNPAPPPSNPSNNSFGGMNPDMMNMMMKIAPMFSSINKDDKSTNLLNALRPFLKQERQGKLEEASKMIQMMRLIPLLKSSGILGSLGNLF